MIKIEKTEVIGWEHVIRGMRNPMNSWEKSDSYPAVDCNKCGIIDKEGRCIPKDHDCSEFECYEIGPNDHKLMMQLAKGGPVHGKFRRMITVYLDITAPLYWWKEFDTYKVGTVANSCSTMHKIAEKEFTWEDFSVEHLIDYDTCDEEFDNIAAMYAHSTVMEFIISSLNAARDRYLDYKSLGSGYSKQAKQAWWQMIQLLPTSYNQKRTVMLNYEVLHNIYESRKNHKLDEWHTFCEWIGNLPYSEVVVGESDE